MLEACVDLEPTADQVRLARAFVLATLADWDMSGYADDAVLIASEFVTNAVLHARTPVRLTVQAGDVGLLRIEVADDNPRLPVLAPDHDGATSGRGLHAVAAVASNWGSQTEGDGKVVWAEIGTRPEADPDCVDLTDVDSAEDLLDRIDRRRDDPAPA